MIKIFYIFSDLYNYHFGLNTNYILLSSLFQTELVTFIVSNMFQIKKG